MNISKYENFDTRIHKKLNFHLKLLTRYSIDESTKIPNRKSPNTLNSNLTYGQKIRNT